MIAVREILADLVRGRITEATATARLRVITHPDLLRVDEPGISWLHSDSSIPVWPKDYPTLDDRNPASVVGVPWNEGGFAGEPRCTR